MYIYIYTHTHHIFFFCSSVVGHLGFFHSLSIVDIAAINIGVTCPFRSLHLYLWGKSLVVQLLGHWIALFSTFWGTSILFSRVAIPACIPTNSVRGFPSYASPPTSVISWLVHFSHSYWCEVISRGGLDLYSFPWCRVMLSIFHVSVGHFYVFFGEMCVHVFHPFLAWIICFVGVEFDKFFIDFGY